MRNRIIIVGIVAIIFSYFRDSFVISDEAVNLQMVKNMKYSEEFIDRPSYNPGGDLDWERDSVRIIQMTPVLHYIYFYANKVLPGSLIQTSSIVQTIFLIVLVFMLSFLVGMEGREKDRSFDIFFMSFIPVGYLMLLEHEGMMTVCGIVSLFFSSEG